jgi:hypothetical protein
MAPREGNSIVKHGVLDERLNVHGVKGLKLLIGEKCAMLTAEDLGYSGRALDMKVPEYHAPRYVMMISRSSKISANMVTERSPAWLACKRTCCEAGRKHERVLYGPHDSYDSLTHNEMYMTVMTVASVYTVKMRPADP